jgi:hypothetical protein
VLKKLLVSAVCASLVACAVDHSKFPIIDTQISGNTEALSGLYGSYRVTDAGNFQNRIGRVEIYSSERHKPLFKFYDKNETLLDGFSPRSCTVKSDEISCGESGFVLGQYPYLSMTKLREGENYPPAQNSGIFGPSRKMSVVPGGYRMTLRWDYQDRFNYLALQKIE